jgi:hypothetical protein
VQDYSDDAQKAPPNFVLQPAKGLTGELKKGAGHDAEKVEHLVYSYMTLYDVDVGLCLRQALHAWRFQLAPLCMKWPGFIKGRALLQGSGRVFAFVSLYHYLCLCFNGLNYFKLTHTFMILPL